MSLKTFKPYTKSTRGTILVDRSKVWKGKPYKSERGYMYYRDHSWKIKV